MATPPIVPLQDHSLQQLLVDVDTESTVDLEFQNTTDSLDSEVTNYRFENGRRYHGYRDGLYHLPNDEAEGERLNFQHRIWVLTLDGMLHLAPLGNDVQDVLDICTGTGIWAMEFADLHPSATVIGTDLSPIQPSLVPPNCEFMVDDSESDWAFDRKFDFIHSRMIMIGWRDWPKLFRQSYENLKPGGWIEIQDFSFPAKCDDDSADDNDAFIQWSRYISQAASMAGCDLGACRNWHEQLQEAGFCEIQKRHLKWPTTPWAVGEKEKIIGHLVYKDIMDGLAATSLALFTRYFLWTREQVELYLMDVRNNLRNYRTHHTYIPVQVFYARKRADVRVNEKAGFVEEP